MRAPEGRTPRDWRRAVIAHRGRGLTGEARALLLWIAAEHMRADCTLSVPRARLAAELGVHPSRITEWLAIAHEVGLLDTVQSGKPGRTATYAAMFPGPADGARARTKPRRRHALDDGPAGAAGAARDGAGARTSESPVHGAARRTLTDPDKGACAQSTSSKRPETDERGREPLPAHHEQERTKEETMPEPLPRHTSAIRRPERKPEPEQEARAGSWTKADHEETAPERRLRVVGPEPADRTEHARALIAAAAADWDLALPVAGGGR